MSGDAGTPIYDQLVSELGAPPIRGRELEPAPDDGDQGADE